MKKTLVIIPLLAALTAVAAHEADDRIARVERGLRTVNVIEGDPTWTIEERMEHYGVPGVGIAVIVNRRVAWFEVYGRSDRETGARVTRETLFQAGSVSKPVAAFGAMKMVENGELRLDEPVNEKLTTWQIPDNEFTEDQAVTLTHLASHTGGLTVHGFPGYAIGARVPTLVQVLDGSGPANTDAIRVNQAPGSAGRYSGGGYTVMQQLMIDVGRKPFPELMRRLVFQPIGMEDSSFRQPLPTRWLKRAAAGVLPDGTSVPGKRHVYPEMAAAGLWTTSADLARFAAEVQLALAGESKVLSRELAEAMVEPVDSGYGRGFALGDQNGELYFRHGGWDEGFCAELIAHRERGYGAVVMINSNHPAFIGEVIRGLAVEYGWAGYEARKRHPMPDAALAAYPGRYRYNGEQSMTVYREDDRLFLQYTGGRPEEMIHVGEGRFVRRERTTPITFGTENEETVFEFIRRDGELQRHHRLADGEKVPRDWLAAGEKEKALAAYRKLAGHEDPAASEGYLNTQGLELIGESIDMAIDLLRINCELYPKSANTWDSLGYAYRQAGDRDNAIRYYEKALTVDVRFPSAIEALKQLAEEK